MSKGDLVGFLDADGTYPPSISRGYVTNYVHIYKRMFFAPFDFYVKMT